MTSRVHQGYSLTISHPRLHFWGKTINVRTEKDDQEQRPDCLLNKKYKFLSFLSRTHNWISIMCIHFKIIYRRLQPNILINWRCLFPRHRPTLSMTALILWLSNITLTHFWNSVLIWNYESTKPRKSTVAFVSLFRWRNCSITFLQDIDSWALVSVTRGREEWWRPSVCPSVSEGFPYPPTLA